MDRINTENALPALFGAGKRGFHGGNPLTGEQPTFLSEVWCNGVQESIVRTIERAGLTPNAENFDLFVEALVRLFWDGKDESPWVSQKDLQRQIYASADSSGSAPNYTATLTPALPNLTTQTRLHIRFNGSSAVAATLDVDGTGVKPLKQLDGVGGLMDAVIVDGLKTDVVYDGQNWVVR